LIAIEVTHKGKLWGEECPSFLGVELYFRAVTSGGKADIKHALVPRTANPQALEAKLRPSQRALIYVQREREREREREKRRQFRLTR
jgi:hypothetical protein